jgi:hypothetical protein
MKCGNQLKFQFQIQSKCRMNTNMSATAIYNVGYTFFVITHVHYTSGLVSLKQQVWANTTSLTPLHYIIVFVPGK